MAFIIVLLYVALVLLVCAAVVFSGFRAFVVDFFNRKVFWFYGVVSSPVRWGARALSQGSLSVSALSARLGEGWTRHRWLLVGTLMGVLLPSMLVWMLKSRVDVGHYSERSGTDDDAVIASVLAGEQLVPPLPLPPEIFATREVLAERPMLVTASRDWRLLQADFEQRLLHVFKRMREHGYDMALIEGYRSPERQDQLAAAGPHVTNARAFQSQHQFGRAADCAFLRDGRLVISERDPWAMRGYELYGQEAEAVGMVWGGRWKMMDFGHVELRPRGVR